MYKDFYTNKDIFDFSEYPENSMFYDATDKKVIHKMKDKATRVSIVKFVGLRYKNRKDKIKVIKKRYLGRQKDKRIHIKTLSKQINHKEYINKAFEKKRIRHEMMKKKMQSKFHHIGTYNINNI